MRSPTCDAANRFAKGPQSRRVFSLIPKLDDQSSFVSMFIVSIEGPLANYFIALQNIVICLLLT